MSENPQKYNDNAVGQVASAVADLFNKGTKRKDKQSKRAKDFADANGSARGGLDAKTVKHLVTLLNASTDNDVKMVGAEGKQARKNVKSSVKSMNKVNAQGGTVQKFKTGLGGTVEASHTRPSTVSAESPAVPSQAKSKATKAKAAAPAKTAPKRAPTPKVAK